MAYILVVDDDEATRKLVYDVLFEMGHTICEASTGKDAIRLCKQYGFDLIILGYSMPDMDGLEAVWQFGSQSPYILHTAEYDNRELSGNAHNAGALGVIRKIINIELFRQEIRLYLLKKRWRNGIPQGQP